MAVIRPFRAVRPDPAVARRVAAVPYDVVDTDEARALAGGNPLELSARLARRDRSACRHRSPRRHRVSRRGRPVPRAEAGGAFRRRGGADGVSLPSDADGHGQTGVAACYSLAEYDSDVIKKHERTRQDKEDDRTRHMVELRAQTGPGVSGASPDRAGRRDCRAGCGRAGSHSSTSPRSMACGTRSGASTRTLRAAFVEAFTAVEALYIADGHHRAASAARAREAVPRFRRGASSFSPWRFRRDQLRILPYNRVVRDLNGMTPEHFLGEVARSVRDEIGPADSLGEGRGVDVRRGRVAHGRSRERRRRPERP